MSDAAVTAVTDAEQGHENHQQFELIVDMPEQCLSAVHVRNMRATEMSTGSDGMGTAVFKSVRSTDWSTTFDLTVSGEESRRLSVQPWLCLSAADAVSSAKRGSAVTESKRISIGATGQIWTVGTFGQGLETSCSYGETIDSASGMFTSVGTIGTFQNEPSLCDSPARSKSSIKIQDMQGATVSSPEVCVARFGQNGGDFAARVGVTLERVRNAAKDLAFTLTLDHCVNDLSIASQMVSADEILASTCSNEIALLEVGEVTSAGTPPVYRLKSGTWKIVSASVDREATHTSNIDLTFESSSEKVYRVVGHLEVPQVIF
jgi:hypothetical protein